MAQYKQLVTENWKWSIFHNRISAFFKKVAIFSASSLVLVLILSVGLYIGISKIKFGIAEKKTIKPDHSAEVIQFLNPALDPIRISQAELTENYFSASDLPALEQRIIQDLNTSGKISIEHVELKPNEYRESAQKTDFVQLNISDDILIFESIVYFSGHIDRFVAVARKFDKWRFAVLKSPLTEPKKSLGNLPDTSEKIYKIIKG